MSRLITGLLPLAGLVLVLAGPAPLRAAPGDDLLPARVEPLAERSIGILPWETTSSSPYGSWRSGGFDERRFTLSPDGTLLATEDAGGWQLELWDTDTGKSLGRFGRIEDPAALAFSPDGKALVSAGGSNHDGGRVALWDVARQALIRGLDEGVNFIPFTAVAFSPDGKTLALGGVGGRRSPGKATVYLWDVGSGDEVGSFEGPAAAAENPLRRPSSPVWGLGFSPDGRSLAVVAAHRVFLWELATGKERCLLGTLPAVRDPEGRGEVAPIAFAPDGRTLAVGWADGSVRFWDVAGGTELPPLAAHRGRVRALRYAPDGKTLTSFGWDNKLLTWPARAPNRDWRPRPHALAEKEVEALWEDLRGDDPLALYGAVRALAAAPQQTLPFLRRRLKPVPPIDSQRIDQLVADLTQEDFNARKRAARELRQLGDLALPALRAAVLRNRGTVQERLLTELEKRHPTRDQLQAVRGVEVLARMGKEDASPLLDLLARGAAESSLTREAKTALDRLAAEAVPALAVTPEAPWADLASEDAPRAYQAVRALVARPGEAVPFLARQLGPLAGRETSDDDPKRVERLIAQLDSDEFAARDKASRELTGLGKRAEPALRQALAGAPSPEMKRRLENVLEQIAKPRLSPERLQAGRALEALELIGNEDARRALEGLSKEARNRWLKQAVAESLQRLDR
jgi:hypothetical protein